MHSRKKVKASFASLTWEKRLTVCHGISDYMLDILGFGQKWESWIHTCISSTSFVVLINGGPSTFFSAPRGLRQGDPLSTLLFIIVMEALNTLVERARDLQLLKSISVANNNKNIEVSHLFFADDTLFFCQSDIN